MFNSPSRRHQVPDSVARVRGHTSAPFTCDAAGRTCRNCAENSPNCAENSPKSPKVEAGAAGAEAAAAGAAALAALTAAFPGDAPGASTCHDAPGASTCHDAPGASTCHMADLPPAGASLPAGEVLAGTVAEGDPVVAFPIRHVDNNNSGDNNNGGGGGDDDSNCRGSGADGAPTTTTTGRSGKSRPGKRAEPNVDNNVEVSAVLAAAPSRDAIVAAAAAADPFAADLCTAFSDLLWRPLQARCCCGRCCCGRCCCTETTSQGTLAHRPHPIDDRTAKSSPISACEIRENE